MPYQQQCLGSRQNQQYYDDNIISIFFVYNNLIFFLKYNQHTKIYINTFNLMFNKNSKIIPEAFLKMSIKMFSE